MSDIKISEKLLKKIKSLTGRVNDNQVAVDVIASTNTTLVLDLGDNITASVEHTVPGRLKAGDRVTFDDKGLILNIAPSKVAKKATENKAADLDKKGCDFERKMCAN